MTSPTVYLVSGANRGIGLGLVAEILKKHDSAFVYAGARNPDKADSLLDLKTKYPGRLEIVKLVSADVEGNKAVAQEIERRHGRIDTVIANAGICDKQDLVAEVKPESMDEHFRVNVKGTIVLFQAVYQLLKKSSNPRFVPVSSAGGCLDGVVVHLPIGRVAYGASKAALNWATRKIHFENNWLVAFPISPGPVSTDMLDSLVKDDVSGTIDEILKSYNAITTAEAAERLIKLVDESTREKDGGEFIHVDGSHLKW